MSLSIAVQALVTHQQEGPGAADGLDLLVAGEARKALIGVHEAPGAVGDEDAVGHEVEHAAAQRQHVLLLRHLSHVPVHPDHVRYAAGLAHWRHPHLRTQACLLNVPALRAAIMCPVPR